MEHEINQISPKIKNTKKRVLFIITQSEFGGAQRFLYELTSRLDKEKYEILVASDSGEKSYFLNSLEQKEVKTKQLKFLKREINPIFDCLGIIELMGLINNFKPDYLHLNSSKTGVLGSIAAFKIKALRPKKFKNLKIIYRIGGWSFNDPWPLWKKKIFILAEKITAKFKDVIVVNSKSDFEQAIKLNIKPKKELKLIYNGIDALKIEFLTEDKARQKLLKKRFDFIIGTIANFYQTKGLSYFIKAAKILKEKFEKENIKFLIIGDGEERKNIERLIEETGLKNEIILAGQIPEARKFMKAFDIFVLPSVKEGFPWVILEAMAAKVPVISTSVGAVPEIIENGKNGILVEPKNPRQIAEAIRYLMENEHARQEFALRAHQTALFKFPIEKMVRETEMLFE
mgnify:CR=1 FL=1